MEGPPAERQASRLCFIGHVMMENRSGLAVDATLTLTHAHATGTAEREAALAMLDRRRRGGRRRVEEVFGWVKAQAGFDQVKVRGRRRAEAVFTFATAAYNLIRIPRLLAEAAR